MAKQRFVSLKVTPGVECRVNMPPCSALEIKHAALAAGGPSTGRCTLECDLATHHFVLCSLPPGGHKQATLGTVITNDPDANAWLFFRARGPQTFHVLGRLSIDNRRSAAPAKPELSSRAADAAVDSDDEDWPSASNIVPSARSAGSGGQRQKGGEKQGKAQRASDAMSDDDEGEGEEEIEVLLPEGDDVVEYSDAASDASEDFVQWMSSRTTSSHEAPTGAAGDRISAPVAAAGDATMAAQGGSRTQRRRAALKRARSVAASEADDWDHDGGEEGAGKVGSKAPAAGKRASGASGGDQGRKKGKQARR